jgi:hypothetical protein
MNILTKDGATAERERKICEYVKWVELAKLNGNSWKKKGVSNQEEGRRNVYKRKGDRKGRKVKRKCK